MKYKLKTLPPGNQVLIGRGKLTWPRAERVSDRYGSIWLMDDKATSLSTSAKAEPMWIPPSGQLGSIYAKIIDARESTHVGDFFRGLSPTTPQNGDIFLLGTGTASTESVDDINTLRLTPIKPRNSDWLNPRALYNCHESIVELIWIPEQTS